MEQAGWAPQTSYTEALGAVLRERASSLGSPPTLQTPEMEPVWVSAGVTHISFTRKGGSVHT